MKMTLDFVQLPAEFAPIPSRATPAAAVQAPAAAKPVSQRSYAGAAFGRTTADWVSLSTSADAELFTSLRTLRNRSRQLIRDNEYAKNARRIVVNNVIGQGIGFQSQVMMRRGNRLNDTVNDAVEKAWRQWSRAKRCHTAGKLSWPALQRQLMGCVFADGEVFVRLVRQRFADSAVPLALEVIEADQLVDQLSGRAENGNQIRMGVEVDAWQRPVAYWLYPAHPGDIAFTGPVPSNKYLRVPAEEIIHLALFERPGQTRGVPWLHATVTKLRHMGGYEEAEIVRARASAMIMGFRQKPETDLPGEEASSDDDVVDGERVTDMQPATILDLDPGETFQGFNPSTPNSAMEAFMRFMLRSVASGVGASYASLSSDYSQSNYSSSRLALLDDRDGWRILQQWMIDSLCQPVFDAWLGLAVLGGTLDLPGYESDPDIYRELEWQPRGWSWIDPAKEQAAAKSAVRSGHSTLTDDLAEQGISIEALFKRRRRELDLAAQYGLVLDTDPAQVTDKGQAQAVAPAQEAEGGPAAAPAQLNGEQAAAEPEGEPAGEDNEPEAE